MLIQQYVNVTTASRRKKNGYSSRLDKEEICGWYKAKNPRILHQASKTKIDMENKDGDDTW